MTTATQKTISREDNIFATIVINGKTIHTIASKNFSSINEVMNMATSQCERVRGLAHLYIRNQSQGWSMDMLIRINTPATSATETHYMSKLEGRQYTLPF